MPVLTNANWELFAQGVAGGKSATQAYRDAYLTASAVAARSSSSRLLTNDEVLARVREILAKREEAADKSIEKAAGALGIDRQWVMAKLKDNALRALQAVAATNEEGEEIGQFGYNGSVANRALELLGKEIGMFIDRKEIRTGSLLDDADQATVSELRAALVGERPSRLDS